LHTEAKLPELRRNVVFRIEKVNGMPGTDRAYPFTGKIESLFPKENP
jgi:hypothetical protein